MFFVYCIKNKINDKLYIGFSSNCKKRWRSEVKFAFGNKKQRDYNSPLSRAFRKYAGERGKVKEFFEFKVLEEFETKEEALKAEQFWIAHYKTNICKYGDKNGYNMTDGGDSLFGYRFSEEHKLKMSESMKGEKNHFFGKVHTPEVLEYLREINVGRKLSEETKKKIGIGGLGNKYSAKLNWSKVAEIRRIYTEKEGKITFAELSKMFGVHANTINNIIKYKSWKIKPNE